MHINTLSRYTDLLLPDVVHAVAVDGGVLGSVQVENVLLGQPNLHHVKLKGSIMDILKFEGKITKKKSIY